jgi:hypothetical protein
MNRFDHQWRKLTALARSAPVEPEATAPYGFAVRVAARAAALPATPWLSLERFALRGLVAAAACSLAAVAINYTEPSSDQQDNYVSGTTDSMVELLDIS